MEVPRWVPATRVLQRKHAPRAAVQQTHGRTKISGLMRAIASCCRWAGRGVGLFTFSQGHYLYPDTTQHSLLFLLTHCQNVVAGGAPPYAGGLDDCCLAGLCLATPALLAYCGSRDAGELAARTLLQLTHKSEDMARQALLWGDLLAAILAAAARGTGGDALDSIESALVAATAAFSDGRVDLEEAVAAFPCSASFEDGAEDEADAAMHAADIGAFHGARARFSLR